MRYGVREICDVVFKAKSKVTIGGIEYPAGAPVLYIDSAKTSTLEGAATTVYATGGKGNTRLLTWEGEKTLTFTVEDALLSPISFAMLSGAGLLNNSTTAVKVHKTHKASVTNGKVALPYAVASNTPIYVIPMDGDDFIGAPTTATLDNQDTTNKTIVVTGNADVVFVDYYTTKTANVSELQIDAATFGGYYYVEASTLFKRQADGVDAPVEITIPKVKIQSNFTFSMSATGDPSTFTFTMDAMPDFTFFNPNKKVLCAMQIIEEATATNETLTTVFGGDHSEFNAEG